MNIGGLLWMHKWRTLKGSLNPKRTLFGGLFLWNLILVLHFPHQEGFLVPKTFWFEKKDLQWGFFNGECSTMEFFLVSQCCGKGNLRFGIAKETPNSPMGFLASREVPLTPNGFKLCFHQKHSKFAISSTSTKF